MFERPMPMLDSAGVDLAPAALDVLGGELGERLFRGQGNTLAFSVSVSKFGLFRERFALRGAGRNEPALIGNRVRAGAVPLHAVVNPRVALGADAASRVDNLRGTHGSCASCGSRRGRWEPCPGFALSGSW